jgi:hypothetical protein
VLCRYKPIMPSGKEALKIGGCDKGSIRVSEDVFSVPYRAIRALFSISYRPTLPFHGGNTPPNLVGDANILRSSWKTFAFCPMELSKLWKVGRNALHVFPGLVSESFRGDFPPARTVTSSKPI